MGCEPETTYQYALQIYLLLIINCSLSNYDTYAVSGKEKYGVKLFINASMRDALPENHLSRYL